MLNFLFLFLGFHFLGCGEGLTKEDALLNQCDLGNVWLLIQLFGLTDTLPLVPLSLAGAPHLGCLLLALLALLPQVLPGGTLQSLHDSRQQTSTAVRSPRGRPGRRR